MDIKQLNEVLNIYSDGRFKYADIDAKAVYDNCINADFGSHTFEEADKFKEFVGIDENSTEEELRAIRNTLVKYWADNMDKTEEGFKMGDQMQFFTTVIDMTIDNLLKDESINENIDVDKQKLKDLMFKYLDDIDVKAPNYYKKQLKVDKEHKDYIDVLTVGIAKDYLKGTDLQAPLQAQFDVEHVLTDNFEKWLNEYQAQFNESLNENNLRTDLIENLENDIVDLTSTIDSLMVKLKEYAANWDFEKQTNYYERIAEILQGAEVNLRNVEKRIK